MQLGPEPARAAGPDLGEEPAGLGEILAEVARRRGLDFRDYRPEALRRGLRTRMAERREVTLTGYLGALQDDLEVTRLVEAMVVPWSRFFRNPAVFTALAERVLPLLAFQHLERRPLRAWCVGAATGEEAWSLAMLMATTLDVPSGPEWRLYATDIDRRTLALAEAGRYPRTALDSVGSDLRARFFSDEGPQLSVVRDLRSRVRFDYHDLLGATLAPAAAVLAAFDLILVRNVLIYFDRRLQEKALARLTATLQPGGVLVLGEVETLPEPLHHRLEPYPGLDPDLRIYQVRGP